MEGGSVASGTRRTGSSGKDLNLLHGTIAHLRTPPEASPQLFSILSQTSETGNMEGAMSPLTLTPVLSPVVSPFGLPASPLTTTPGGHNMRGYGHLSGKGSLQYQEIGLTFRRLCSVLRKLIDLAREHIRDHLRTTLFRWEA